MCQGKMKFCKNAKELPGNLFQLYKARMFGPYVSFFFFFFAKFVNFWLL